MKVGDYVRTKHYGISKIADIYNKDKIELDKENAFGIKGVCYMVENIIKSSPNIIDLIEVGDYVNGSKVVSIEKHDEKLYVCVQKTEYCNACDEEENIYYQKDTINSIVTHEQFSQMEYKIGE